MYVDIAGWHLFLRDMSAVPGLKMAAALAAQLGPTAAGAGRGGLRESDVSAVLKRIPVDVGGGRVTVRGCRAGQRGIALCTAVQAVGSGARPGQGNFGGGPPTVSPPPAPISQSCGLPSG